MGTQIVRVRDYKLGVLFYSFQVAILIYLIVHGIIISRGKPGPALGRAAGHAA
jgi:hypothetical protein